MSANELPASQNTTPKQKRSRRGETWITVPGLFSLPSGRQKKDRPASVYVIGFVEHPEFVKIGIATDITYRLIELQTGNPFRLQLLGEKVFPTKRAARSLEQALHKLYAEERVSGEWFRLADAQALVQLINCAEAL